MQGDGPVRIGLMGAGNVGGGVARVLREKSATYSRQAGRPLVLSAILVRDVPRARSTLDDADRHLLTDDPGKLLDDPDIAVVIDAMPNEQPAFDYISRALTSGKYVITANKEVMAKRGSELFALARANQVDIFYEASVGGGIPIIAPLKRDLAGNRILSLSAIINGTTNYILTAMSRHGTDFSEALAAAQELGYAEANPANDVEGEDARYKLAILTRLAFGVAIQPEQIFREGITRLSARDFRYAKELGYEIKLLALARARDGGVQARVHPALVSSDEPLAKVDGVLNAVQIEGDLTGRVLFEGRGAGSMPTTSAVIGDLMEAVRSLQAGGRDGHTPEESGARVLPMDDLRTRYYIRVTVADQPGVLARIAAALGDAEISISSVIQKETNVDAQTAELVIMTHEAREASMRSALAAVEALDVVEAIGNFLRVEHL